MTVGTFPNKVPVFPSFCHDPVRFQKFIAGTPADYNGCVLACQEWILFVDLAVFEDIEEAGPSVAVPSMAKLQAMTDKALEASSQKRECPKPLEVSWLADPEVVDLDEEDVEDSRTGCFHHGEELSSLLLHLRQNLGLYDPAPTGVEEEDFFAHYQMAEPESVPLHLAIHKVLTSECMEEGKGTFPHFL
ncbi:hypothetical protein NDU88_003803 [Pleurodeles waltl]|uniref:Uncharacterized protein n=1 Tax=Pleurodeles waltl TaxID=8319 RepID=A0AAV7NHP0_PLEWA|nr:hypothetical protein NDU88_003803 [Pleurodeles waltl]